MKKFNVAIIGCGTICMSAHAPKYSENPRAEIKYLCDLLPEKAEAIKKEYKLDDAVIVTDYKELLNKDDIDVVSVCLPNYLHAPVTIDFLNAGKDVLCEKPISTNVKDALAMQAAAEKNNRILNIGVVNRFNTYVNELRKLVEAGEFGEMYHIYCAFRQQRSIPGMGGWFTTKAMSGGGSLIDWGVHYLDLILYIMGMPNVKTVSGKSFCKLAKNMKDYVFDYMWAGPPDYNGTYDVDDSVTGFIRTDGPTITFNGAWAQNLEYGDTSIEFLGTKGGAKLTYGGSFRLTLVRDGKIETTTPEFEKADMFYEEMDAFLDAVEKREKNKGNIDNVIVTQKLLNGIYDSSDSDREVVIQ